LRGMTLSSVEPAPSLTSAWTDSRGEGHHDSPHAAQAHHKSLIANPNFPERL
jgi:hypothetical protein